MSGEHRGTRNGRVRNDDILLIICSPCEAEANQGTESVQQPAGKKIMSIGQVVDEKDLERRSEVALNLAHIASFA